MLRLVKNKEGGIASSGCGRMIVTQCHHNQWADHFLEQILSSARQEDSAGAINSFPSAQMHNW